MTIIESVSGEQVQRERVCPDCRNTGWVPYVAELPNGTFEDALALCHCPKSIGEVPEVIIVINSFTKPGISYNVDLEEKTCECPAFTHGPLRYCKHLVLAQAIRRLRERRTGSTEHDEEMLFDLARRIFTKITAKDSCVDSKLLLQDVRRYRYTTQTLVKAAERRHTRVQEMTKGRVA